MTKVQYKCFNALGELVKIVNTLQEAKNFEKETEGHYEIYYTYKESYTTGYAWAFKRLSGHQT